MRADGVKQCPPQAWPGSAPRATGLTTGNTQIKLLAEAQGKAQSWDCPRPVLLPSGAQGRLQLNRSEQHGCPQHIRDARAPSSGLPRVRSHSNHLIKAFKEEKIAK